MATIYTVTTAAEFLRELTAANSGDTIQVEAGTYAFGSSSANPAMTISKSLTIIGRSSASAGARPVFNITTANNGTAIEINASNVTIKGIELNHNSNAQWNDAVISLTSGNTNANPVNNNIIIDDCKIIYSEFVITCKAKGFTVSNCNLHNRYTSIDSRSRAFMVYSYNGDINILNNTYTATIQKIRARFLEFNHVAIEGSSRKNGVVNFIGNKMSGFKSSERAIYFEPGYDANINSNDKSTYNISNNEIIVESYMGVQGTTPTARTQGDCMLVLHQSKLDFSNINLITINDNIFDNTAQTFGNKNGLVRLVGVSPGVWTNTDISGVPKFKIYSNTITAPSLNVSTNPYNVKNADLLIITSPSLYTLPANIDSILDTTAPAPPTPPPAPTAAQLQINGTTAGVSSSGSTTTINADVEVPLSQVREVVVPAANSTHTLQVQGQAPIQVRNFAGVSGEFVATESASQVARVTFQPDTGNVAYQDKGTGQFRVAFDTSKPATVNLEEPGYVLDQNGRKVTADGVEVTLAAQGLLDVKIPEVRQPAATA
jgi:hypothetical protein